MDLDPELQEQLGAAMQAFLSNEDETRDGAYQFLHDFKSKEPLLFVKYLIFYLSNVEMPSQSRALAAIFLYQSLHKRTPDQQRQFLASWKKLDDLETRDNLRLAAYNGVTSGDKELQLQCSNLLGLFYSIENCLGMPESSAFTFSDSLNELLNIANESSDVEIRILLFNVFTYFALNLIEVNDKCYSKQSMIELSPIIYNVFLGGMTSDVPELQVKAIESLSKSFLIFKRTFSFEKDRAPLLNAVFQIIQSGDPDLLSPSYQLLMICIDTCYYQMTPHMEDIELITQNDLCSEIPERQVEACFLWSVIAEVESDIQNPDKESIKKKHLDKVSMVLNENILYSKFAFENFFDILVQLICSVDPEETDAHMSSERTPQQAALSCMDLLIKAIKRDALPRIYDFVDQNASSEDWRIRYTAALLLNGASQDLNLDDLKNILVAFDFFVNAIVDDVPRISDVAMWSLGRLIKNFPFLVMDQDLFGRLCESVAGRMDVSDALTGRACWLLSICFSQFSKDDEESPLVSNFEKFSELLLECADKFDDTAPDAAFGALDKLLEHTPGTIADQYNKLFELITAKLQYLIAQYQNESIENNDKYTQQMIGLLSLVHHIIMNVGPMISNISDQLMEMLNEALDFQDGNFVCEILPAMGGIARAIQSDFTKFIPTLMEKVFTYLESEETILSAASFISDIFNSSPDPPFPDDFIERIVGVLSEVLNNDNLKPQTRISVFSAIANVAFYIGDKCESWIGDYLDSLEAEAKSMLSDSDTVDHDSAQSFTLECIIIYQGLLPIMKDISIGERRVRLFFNLFEKIDKLEYIRNFVLPDCVVLIREIANQFQKKLNIYLNKPAVLRILNSAIKIKKENPELTEFSDFAQETLDFIQSL